MKAKIRVSLSNSGEAEAVSKALQPDDAETPSYLKVSTISEGKYVESNIICEDKLETLISTVDDILGSIVMVKKTLSAMRTSMKRQRLVLKRYCSSLLSSY
jgi:hypothetical protein